MTTTRRAALSLLGATSVAATGALALASEVDRNNGAATSNGNSSTRPDVARC
jgi:hypothetical protein